MRIGSVCALLLTLAACASGPGWTKPGFSQADFNQDKYSCDKDMRTSTNFGTGAERQKNEDAFVNECLVAKGYKKQ